jgi:RNA polymerase sigma-70 factor (ECF subfamily)
MKVWPERDEWIMAQVAAGHRDHLEPLVRRYASALVAFLSRLCGDRQRGEDLFQEVFLTVWLKRKLYTYPRSFKAWLYAIALNKTRSDLRRKTAAAQPLEHAPADTAPAPDETIADRELAQRVALAVQQLPGTQRAVVALRMWQDLSYSEIAKMLGKTEGTVRSHMFHAIKTLRPLLQDVAL